jgi:hypothetical protein
MVLGMNLLAFVALLCAVGMGLVDIYLLLAKKKTISQKVQAWTSNRWLDVGIMVGILVLVWWILTPNTFVPCLYGCILGHFFWNKE